MNFKVYLFTFRYIIQCITCMCILTLSYNNFFMKNKTLSQRLLAKHRYYYNQLFQKWQNQRAERWHVTMVIAVIRKWEQRFHEVAIYFIDFRSCSLGEVSCAIWTKELQMARERRYRLVQSKACSGEYRTPLARWYICKDDTSAGLWSLIKTLPTT